MLFVVAFLFSVWFGFKAFGIASLVPAYALVALAVFIVAGGIVYWVERYR